MYAESAEKKRGANNMASEDITFCTNKKCKYMKCDRNPKHIKQLIPHSFADYDGTEYCYRKVLQDAITEEAT